MTIEQIILHFSRAADAARDWRYIQEIRQERLRDFLEGTEWTDDMPKAPEK